MIRMTALDPQAGDSAPENSVASGVDSCRSANDQTVSKPVVSPPANGKPPAGSGDSAAAAEFVRLYALNSRRIYAYLLTLVPNWADAEDVFQDVSAVLWEKFSEFTPGTDFGAWAFRIAHFKALKRRSQNSARSKLFSELAMDAVAAEMAAMSETLEAQYRQLSACFTALPEADRQLLQQRYEQDGTPRAIAERNGWPVQQVYRSLDRVRRALLRCVSRKTAKGGVV
jgi:RNA polymerase sigma-70 factor (ECF subfamily)